MRLKISLIIASLVSIFWLSATVQAHDSGSMKGHKTGCAAEMGKMHSMAVMGESCCSHETEVVDIRSELADNSYACCRNASCFSGGSFPVAILQPSFSPETPYGAALCTGSFAPSSSLLSVPGRAGRDPPAKSKIAPHLLHCVFLI